MWVADEMYSVLYIISTEVNSQSELSLPTFYFCIEHNIINIINKTYKTQSK